VIESLALLLRDCPFPALILCRETLQILALNRAARYRFGDVLEAAPSVSFLSLYPATERSRIAELLAAPAREARPLGNLHHTSAERGAGELELTAQPVDSGPTPIWLAWGFDVTPLRRARHELAGCECCLRDVVECIREAVWIAETPAARPVYISPGFGRLWGRTLGHDTALDAFLLGTVHPEDRPQLAAALASLDSAAPPLEETCRFVRPDGSTRWIALRLVSLRAACDAAARVVGIAEDVTDDRNRREQLLRAQRRETVGALASGIAHDLNNVLTPILLAVDTLRSTGLPAADPNDLLGTIHASARRGATVLRQLLNLGRSSTGPRQSHPLGPIVREVATIVRETFPRHIELTVALEPDLPSLVCDPTQIHQLLLNLCLNARDAMPAGGRLQLAIAVSAPPAAAPDAAPLPDGSYLRLTVADDGIGIPAEILPRIFEPFFTTKPHEHGSGLGLAMVRMIARGHHGTVAVRSRPGQGTEFAVYLPAATAATPAPDHPPVSSAPRGNGETILVVDDEASIRRVLQFILEKFGYRVLAASDGGAGLRLFLAHQDSVRLVLTDLAMPGVGGLALAKTLRSFQPTLPIVALTGLDPEATRAEIAGTGIDAVIAKPVATEHLLAQVHRLLPTAPSS
jgi:signal transduction histidine kinase/ActR/RegA family two-component response regulator